MMLALALAAALAATGADDFPGRSGPVAHDVSAATVARAERDAARAYARLPALPPLAVGEVVTIHLVAEVKPWRAAPNLTSDAWTYNGTVPGPTLHVRTGQQVRVILTNHLAEPTTIHWHGLELAPDMDGVPGMSQNEVQPGRSFVYEFTPRTPGTYIYHTHYDDLNQLDRGLYGAIVVEPSPAQAEHYDRDYLMLISSWRDHSDTENFFSINGKSYPLTKPFEVRPGERVRIREIDISGTEFHTMHLHGHRFSVIAVDGQPVPVGQRQAMVTVTLGPGEARDIAFVADAQAGTWMIHCHVADHMLNGGMGPGGLVSAIHYAGSRNTFAALAVHDVMDAPPPSIAANDPPAPAQGQRVPLGFLATLILGAIAGLTIFFGLPVAALRKVSPSTIAFLNAAAVGVLFFLLFDILQKAGDPVGAALDAMRKGAPPNDFSLLVVVYVIGLSAGLIGLVYTSRWLMQRQAAAAAGTLAPLGIATVIAIGVGLHNFSEGLAIGQSAATGAIQLALLLIIGFGLHNMTEGFGIAAPLAGGAGLKAPTWVDIARLGVIGGGPTFLGTALGYRFVSPTLSVLFLTLAAGAIIYVIGEMTKAGGRIGFTQHAAVGVLIGFLAGFATDLILSAAGA